MLENQFSICTHVKGQIINAGATNSEVAAAIEYTTGNSVTTYTTRTYPFLKNEINNGDIPVIKMTWDTSGAHVVVLSGVSDSNASSTLTGNAQPGLWQTRRLS